MIPLVAHMLLRITSDDDLILTNASLDAVYSVVDQIIIFDTSPVERRLNATNDKITTIYESEDYCTRVGFAVARNRMIEVSPQECYILWLDNDEGHFTNQLQQLKDAILAPERYTDVSMHFIHFCIGSNFYEKFEKRRITIFRRTPDTHWEGKVHEKIIHTPGERTIFFSDYIYMHLGYVRSQEYIFDRWRQYALLDGQENPTVDWEYPDKQCLEHRRESLMPYFGPYPEALPLDWIQSKLINQ